MATFVFGMNVTLDGYVDHTAAAPSTTLFRHFIDQAREQAGSIYGRRLYEIMRYWDEDHPEWPSRNPRTESDDLKSFIFQYLRLATRL